MLAVSILITRVATIALIHTGLSREAARFQARSAFTGTGFTTNEAEGVVNHPVRRRIVMVLMLLGNAGIVTVVSSLILAFVDLGEGGASLWLKLLFLASGLALLWWAASSAWVDQRLSRLISWALRRYTRLDVRDYASLLHLAGEYQVVELRVDADDWMAGHTLGEMRLREEGVMVLAIVRVDGSYLGVPQRETEVCAGDVLIAYGRVGHLEQLDQRRRGWRGEREHRRAVAEQERHSKEEQRQRPDG